MKCPVCNTESGERRFCPACGWTIQGRAPTIRPDGALGTTVDGILVERKLGEGRTARVYEGVEVATGRRVAIRLVQPDRAASVFARLAYARAAIAPLTAPQLVGHLRAGQAADGTVFVATELRQAPSLHHVFREEAPFAPARAYAIAAELCLAYESLHAAGVYGLHPAIHKVYVSDRVALDAFNLYVGEVRRCGPTSRRRSSTGRPKT